MRMNVPTCCHTASVLPKLTRRASWRVPDTFVKNTGSRFGGCQGFPSAVGPGSLGRSMPEEEAQVPWNEYTNARGMGKRASVVHAIVL